MIGLISANVRRRKARTFLTAAGIAVGVGAVVALLALSDDGAPAYDHDNAAAFAALGCAVFACTPEQFPPMMAAAIEGRDVQQWAAEHGITTARPGRTLP